MKKQDVEEKDVLVIGTRLCSGEGVCMRVFVIFLRVFCVLLLSLCPNGALAS